MSTDCIIAEGPRDKDGYVRKHYNGLIGEHRQAWIDANGPIPNGLFVCHHCDNPPCVNVDHLFLGTNRDNQLDYFKKNEAKVREAGRAAAKKQWENPEFRAKMAAVLKANGHKSKGKPKPDHVGFQKGHEYFPGRWE